MITSNRLKIWTLITHGLIIIGAGHGIACLFLLEAFSFVSFVDGSFPWQNPVFVISLPILIGQLSIIFSMRHYTLLIKRILLISGAILLNIPILYFLIIAQPDNYTIVTFTTFPFFICTILIFFGSAIRNAWRYFIDHIP
jgi:hypothetical protein